jgi:hypothetical protein
MECVDRQQTGPFTVRRVGRDRQAAVDESLQEPRPSSAIAVAAPLERAAWPERFVGALHARPQSFDFWDLRFPAVRGRAALAAEPFAAGGCPNLARALRLARGRSVPCRSYSGPARAPENSPGARRALHARRQVHALPARSADQIRAARCAIRLRWVRRPAERAALHPTCSGRLARALRGGPPAGCVDHVRADFRAHPAGFRCAAHPAQRPTCLARYRAHSVSGADLRAGHVDQAGPRCRATRLAQRRGSMVQHREQHLVRPGARVPAEAAPEPRLAVAGRACSATGSREVLRLASPARLRVGFVPSSQRQAARPAAAARRACRARLRRAAQGAANPGPALWYWSSAERTSIRD